MRDRRGDLSGCGGQGQGVPQPLGEPLVLEAASETIHFLPQARNLFPRPTEIFPAPLSAMRLPFVAAF